MRTSEVLRTARALIEKPEKWTRDVWARDASGAECLPEDSSACAFCTMGAIRRIAGRGEDEFFHAIATLRDCVGAGIRIPEYNDTHSHAEVLALFDRAIAAAEESESK